MKQPLRIIQTTVPQEGSVGKALRPFGMQNEYAEFRGQTKPWPVFGVENDNASLITMASQWEPLDFRVTQVIRRRVRGWVVFCLADFTTNDRTMSHDEEGGDGLGCTAMGLTAGRMRCRCGCLDTLNQ